MNTFYVIVIEKIAGDLIQQLISIINYILKLFLEIISYYFHTDGLAKKICWHRRRMILNYLLPYMIFKLVEKIN